MDSFNELIYHGTPQWNEEKDTPDLTGKVAIVTGGAVGCGYRAVLTFVQKGCRVVIATRSKEKSEKAIAEIKKEIPDADVVFIPIDLADLSTVKVFADAFTKAYKKLDILILNAGVMAPEVGSKTKDGYDLQLGTNVIGHFALIQALLPIMLSTAKETKNVRVVHVSSAAHRNCPNPPIPWDDEAFWNSRTTYNNWIKYSSSKAGNILMALAMNDLYNDKGIISNTIHPGALNTELGRHTWLISTFGKWFLSDAKWGGVNITCAATNPKLTGGEYIIPWGKQYPVKKELLDENLQKATWQRLKQEIKKHGCYVYDG